MSKVHEGWDLAHGKISIPIRPIDTKPTHVFEQTWIFWWWLWQTQHVCMVVHYTDTTIKSRLAHEQGSWSLRLDSQSDFYSTLAIFHQANPRFGGKPTSFVAILAPNTRVYGCRLVLHPLNFNNISLWRFVKPGLGIIDRFYSNIIIFYQNNPHFRGKLTSFMAILA